MSWIRVVKDMGGCNGYGHGGGISGFVRLPKERVYVVVLYNFEWAKSSDKAKKL